MFCSKCGKEVAEGTAFCPFCGASLNSTSSMNSTMQNVSANSNDAPSTGFAVLGFFIPIVGLILYLVWKNESPKKAKSCGKGALTGFIVGIAFSIISAIVTCVVMASL